MTTAIRPVTGVAAGVPYLAIPPAMVEQDTPIVVAWHMMEPPRTEAAFAAALPLSGLDAWRIYLGLPMFGDRAPAGGPEEFMRLAYEDAVRNLYGPIVTQAAEEFPAALEALSEQLGLGRAHIGLVGGSAGSAVALQVLAETGPSAGISVDAAVLISPMVQLRPVVELSGRVYGMSYPWGPESLQIADRLDFVARSNEIAGSGQPAIRLVVGADDDVEAILRPADRFRAALAKSYEQPFRVDLVTVGGMAHALAEEPGIEPAPPAPYAAVVDGHATDWLREQLQGQSAHKD